MQGRCVSILIFILCLTTAPLMETVFTSSVNKTLLTRKQAESTIELKDGTTVVGKLQGTVALGGQTQDKKGFAAIYYLIPAEAVSSITKKGIEIRAGHSGGRYAIFFSKKNPLPSDTALLTMIRKLDQDGSTIAEMLVNGLVATESITSKQNPIQVKLQGEFRMKGQQGELIPSLTLNSSSGSRNVAVTEIVEYIQPSKK